MLCHDGGNIVCGIPFQGPTRFCLPIDHYKGQQDIRGLRMGLVRHGLPPSNHGSLDWGLVDLALYNEAFAG